MFEFLLPFLRSLMPLPRLLTSFLHLFMSSLYLPLSFPRRRESTLTSSTVFFYYLIIPAFAGMTKRFAEMTKRLAGIMFLLSSLSAHANDDLKITSDKLIIEKEKASATFSGSVVVRFSDMKLITAKLVAYYDDSNNKRELKKIIIPGKLKAIKNCGSEVVLADSGSFDNQTKKLTLEGNVKVLRDDNVLNTNKLVYLANFESIDETGDAE